MTSDAYHRIGHDDVHPVSSCPGYGCEDWFTGQHRPECVKKRTEWAELADGLENGTIRLTPDSIPVSAEQAREGSEDCTCLFYSYFEAALERLDIQANEVFGTTPPRTLDRWLDAT